MTIEAKRRTRYYMKEAFEDVKDFFIIKKKKRIAAVFERLKKRFTKD